MKPYLLLLPLAVVLCTAPAQEPATLISIPLLNPGFEDDVLSCAPGNCYAAGSTGWVVGPVSGTFKPGPAQYPSGVPEGTNVAGFGNFSSTGSILQTTGTVLRANTTYVLKLSIGQRADVPFTGYVASLMAGNVTLASDNSLLPAPGTFLTDVIVFRSGPYPLLVGRPLQILVKSVGTGEVDVDKVSLEATSW
jgi:hypothetical protein